MYDCPENMDSVIVASGLTKRYGRETVVDGLDLRIESGEIFGFLGPNGAGKTTTLLMFLGLTQPSAGTVSVLGHDPLLEPLKVKSQVGYMAENMGVYAELTARQNLEYVAELNRMSHIGPAVDETLEIVGLTMAADKKAGTFSRGMRQRLGLAETLIKRPRLLFLDEPTLGLDPDGIETMLELIQRLPKERGLTIILSSHLLHLVAKVAHRVMLLRKGKLLAQGSVESLSKEAGLPPDLEGLYRHFFRSSEPEEAGRA
jgi:ABC-2 type transport system ATP-binding protein